jgi:hypothetical protein
MDVFGQLDLISEFLMGEEIAKGGSPETMRGCLGQISHAAVPTGQSRHHYEAAAFETRQHCLFAGSCLGHLRELLENRTASPPLPFGNFKPFKETPPYVWVDGPDENSRGVGASLQYSAYHMTRILIQKQQTLSTFIKLLQLLSQNLLSFSIIVNHMSLKVPKL